MATSTSDTFSGVSIDKLVEGINQESEATESVESATTSEDEVTEPLQKKTVQKKDGTTQSIWNDFLDICSTYESKGKEKPVLISEDILNTLRICNINSSCQKKKINAILMSFILNYKSELKKFIETKTTLL